MRLGAPLGLVALAGLVAVVWLHRQRVRVTRHVVPSLAGWLTLVAAPPRRRRHVPPTALLALHLAVAAAVGLALADPRRAGRPAASGDLALVVDTSGSMAAADRWPAAVAAARAVAAAAGGRITVVDLGPRPVVRLAASGDADAVAAAIDALAPGGSGADVAGALALAAAAAGPAARRVVVTDGALHDPPGAAAVRAVARSGPVEWRIVGTAPDPPNVAVIDAAAGDGRRGDAVVARVANFGPAAARLRAELRVDGRAAGATALELAPGAAAPLRWSVPATGAVAEIVVRRLGDGGAPDGDALPADDAAVVPLGARTRQLQFAGRPGALRRAVAAQPDSEVRWVGLGTLADRGLTDATVIVGSAPAALPLGGAVLADPPPGPWLVDAADPVTGTWQTGAPHAITAGLDLAGAVVAGVRATAAPAWAEVVATVAGRPAAWAGSVGAQRVVVLAFDPDGGTIAGREAFPALVGRAVAWASPALPPPTLAAGEPFDLPPWPVAVVAPDGRRTLAAHRFGDTRAPGLYTIRRTTRPAAGVAEPAVAVGVRAGSARESRLAARSAEALAAAFSPATAAEGAAGGDGADARSVATARDVALRPWLLWLALATLAVETAWRAWPAGRVPGTRTGA